MAQTLGEWVDLHLCFSIRFHGRHGNKLTFTFFFFFFLNCWSVCALMPVLISLFVVFVNHSVMIRTQRIKII